MALAKSVPRFLFIEDGINQKRTNDHSISADSAISGYDEARDEIKEIQNISRTETRLIRTWRIILLALLVITAATVSSVTYVLLQQQEYAAFQASVRNLCTTDESLFSNSSSQQPLGLFMLHSLKNSLKVLETQR
jgi:hypothetical protein